MSISALMKNLTVIEECCSPLREVLDDDEARRLATAFKVLGDPARLKLLSLIAAGPEGEACVCDLIAPVGLSQPTVSHHLKVLHDAGIVTRERRGSWAYFKVVPEALENLRAALAA